MFKSVNGGVSWVPQINGLADPEGFDVQTFAIDASNSSTIYTGTRSGGVFKSEDSGYPLEDIIFSGKVEIDDGSLKLQRVAAHDLNMKADPSCGRSGYPSLDAVDCLFDNIEVPNGLSRLEYCIVMQSANSKYLQASDCVFVGELLGVSEPPSDKEFVNCMRYSRLPDELTDAIEAVLHLKEGSPGTNTRATPIFHEFSYCEDVIAIRALAIGSTAIYVGTNGSGVLRSTNDGETWPEINNGLTEPDDLDIQALAIDPITPTTVYAGTNGGGVFWSDDSGDTWMEKNTDDLTNLDIQALAIDPGPPAIVFAGTNSGGVFTSDDGGDSWAQKRAPISWHKTDRRPARFGEAGYGVLHPATSESIRFGAEDRGEMGAYHHRHYALRDEAAIDKLSDYLPVGIEPVLIPDIRLLRIPIRERSSEAEAETSSTHGGVS